MWLEPAHCGPSGFLRIATLDVEDGGHRPWEVLLVVLAVDENLVLIDIQKGTALANGRTHRYGRGARRRPQ